MAQFLTNHNSPLLLPQWYQFRGRFFARTPTSVGALNCTQVIDYIDKLAKYDTINIMNKALFI